MMRVLLVDDDETVLKSLSHVLADLGHEADGVSNAPDAVEKIESGDYDFAFIDYKMPEHNGLWLMKTADIPSATTVLMMTAFVDREVINEMFKLGGKGYLIKPFAEGEIKQHIEFHSKPA